jgi:hypothetical protein
MQMTLPLDGETNNNSPLAATTARRSRSSEQRTQQRRAGQRTLRRVRNRSYPTTCAARFAQTGLLLLTINTDDDAIDSNNSAAVGDGVHQGQVTTCRATVSYPMSTSPRSTETPLPSPACCARFSKCNNSEGARPGAYTMRGRPIGASHTVNHNSRSPTNRQQRGSTHQLTPDDRLPSHSFGIWLKSHEEVIQHRHLETFVYDAPVRRQSSNAVLETTYEDVLHFNSIPPRLCPMQSQLEPTILEEESPLLK